MIREAIRKSLSKFLFPQSYSTLLLPRTGYNYGKDVDGYSSSIIMACVGWIQRTFPEAPQVVQKRNADGEWAQIDHPLTDLMNNPNPFYDGLLLQQAFIADLVISGNAYMLKVRSGAGRPVQLWWTPSSLITPKWPSGGTEFISHYDYFPGGMAVRVDIKDVVHYRLGIDPNNLRKGRSPLQSLLREIFTDDEAANMTASLLKNMGVPGLVISPMQDSVSQQDAEAVKAYVKERTTGDRRGEPIIIGSATKIDTFGFNPQQMDLRQLRQIPEERISAVLGVPAIVAGLGAGLARSTYSNMQEAREIAYESGIIPLQRIVASQTSHQLLSEYTDDLVNYRVAYDTSEIRVLQDDEDKLSARTVAQVAGGVCKITDAQRILGLPIDDSQDFYLRSYSATPVRSGEDGQSPGPEGTGESEKGFLARKGGEGSGNFGHEGRPGEVGGSGEGGGSSFDPETSEPIHFNVPVDRATAKETASVEKWESNLSESQKNGADDWREFGFKEIRSSQISGESSPEMDERISIFHSALETAPDYDKPVYRGMKKLSAENIQQLSNANDITLEADSSFSGSKYTAAGFSNLYDWQNDASSKPIDSVLFETRPRKAIGKLIGVTEREVIIPKGKAFKVVSRDVIQYESHRARVLHLVLEPK